MRLLVAAALAACLVAPAAWASYPAPTPFDSGNGNLQTPAVSIGVCGYQADGVTARPCAPGAAPSDPNGAAFHGARVLTPSGTAGTAGTIAGAPYPATTGGTTASAANTGYSFGWVCTGAGVGTITTTDGSVLPFSFFSNSGGIGRDSYSIIDAEPGTATGCTFAVFR